MYEQVTQRHEKVIVIAGGPSLIGFNFKRLNDFKGAIISINNSVLYLPRCDYWLTIDMGYLSTGFPLTRFAEKFVGCENKHLAMIPRDMHTLKRVQYFTEDKSEIVGQNSGLAGINLAFHFEPSKILLLGIDMDGEDHWYKDDKFNIGNGEWPIKISKLKELSISSKKILKRRGCLVANGSPDSAIKCFPRLTIEEGLKWINR